ncbi:uncharacterized protein [Apostichopus japonicus]|uniref:uncharacterized protein n=1 Tax=Stichopus japonicus TaxID=307972 RepID=UPI003AB71C68
MSLRYWNEKWRKKMSQLEKVTLTDKSNSRVQIQVLIKKIHESGIASNAPVAMYHQLALAALPKQCPDGMIVYQPKPIGGTTGRPKDKRRGKSRLNDSVWSMTLEDAEQLIEDDDKLFLVLKGSIGVIGKNTITFRAGLPVWVTVSRPVILEAKENTLMIQISGSTLLQATQMYPTVRLNLPPTVA